MVEKEGGQKKEERGMESEKSRQKERRQGRQTRDFTYGYKTRTLVLCFYQGNHVLQTGF